MMVLAQVLFCVFLVLLFGLFAKSWRRSKFPGPPSVPFFGVAGILPWLTTKDIVPLVMEWYEKYGGVFEATAFGMVYVFVSEPVILEQILTSSTNITKGYLEYSFMRPIFNDGLILSDGDKWRSRRKLLTPSFHFKILESSLNGMYRNAEEYVSTLLASGGKPIELSEIIQLSALKIICETAFGVKLNTENKLQNEYIKASKICTDRIVKRYLNFWQIPDFTFRLCNDGKMFFKSVQITHNFDKQVIRQRKELFHAEKNGIVKSGNTKNGQRRAFLDTLLELNNSQPGLFTEADIMEEVDTFMEAGHNTTASALIFAHFLIANHPEVQKRIYEEQMEIFGDDERMPTIQDLNKMIYLEMVIKETLRLYPSIPLYSRLLNEDVRIDVNRVIEAGQTVVVVPYSVHRSKKHWENPEEFIPERFTPGIKRHPFSFIPFSAGPRNCIGQKYAMMELKTVLSTVVRHCLLESVTTSVDLDYSIIIKPLGPILVKVFPRTKASLS